MRIQSSPIRPQTNRPAKVEFPKDEGSHPEAKTEWWYLNGHLEDDQNRTYGIMHALFDMPDAIHGRYNVDLPLMPGATALDTGLTRETEGIHTQTQRFHPQSPFSRLHKGLTEGKLDESFTDDNGTWRMKRTGPKTIHVSGPTGEGQVDLTMTEMKPPLLMGGEGEIKMGPKGLSKYVTYPRLDVEGTLTVDGENRPVHGQAWVDHQWGDMQMYNGYDGWDWFGIQLENDTQINAFRFRDEDGGNAHATVGISRPDGSQDVSEDLRLTAGEGWTSDKTGATYPLSWHVNIPDKQISLEVEPILKDQEMVGTPPYSYPKLALIPSYWEGGVWVHGTVEGEEVKGRGYMELVGYEGDRLLGSQELTPETIAMARKLGEEAEVET
jgi:predicted secreted hydrolase